MSKVYRRVIRKDAADHVHALADGRMTMGMNMKPSQSALAGNHSHLYCIDEVVFESGPAMDVPGHQHSTEMGMTSGPMPMQAAEKFGGPGTPPKEVDLYGGDNPAPGSRTDSLSGLHGTVMRIGTQWVVRNRMGETVAVGRSETEVLQRAKRIAS